MSGEQQTFEAAQARLAEMKRELAVQKRLVLKLMPSRQRRKRLAVRVLFVLLLPVWYALSIGPSMWIIEHLPPAWHHPAMLAFNAVYLPLLALVKAVPPLGAFMEWWVALWIQ